MTVISNVSKYELIVDVVYSFVKIVLYWDTLQKCELKTIPKEIKKKRKGVPKNSMILF